MIFCGCHGYCDQTECDIFIVQTNSSLRSYSFPYGCADAWREICASFWFNFIRFIPLAFFSPVRSIHDSKWLNGFNVRKEIWANSNHIKWCLMMSLIKYLEGLTPFHMMSLNWWYLFNILFRDSHYSTLICHCSLMFIIWEGFFFRKMGQKCCCLNHGQT